jgi:NAD(P)-dependent dehydrogenase (short-subunit alcohol dehydrogenase family)
MNRILISRAFGTLAQKTAVITGGASGIGLALAKRALASNYNVVLADIEANSLQNAVVSLNAPEGRVVTVRCDVSVESDIKNLAEKSFERFGNYCQHTALS